ncbi:MAG: CPBP family intramembrane metalloprotease [Anaerolineales bacterium]|nr:CPBP family intramembrane metalloprotease [Anaerolineales bacterium]
MQKYIEDIKNIKNRMLWGYDLNLIAVVTISTLVIVLWRYHPLNIVFPATELIYWLLVPLAAGFLFFRDKPWDYGIRIGRWKPAIILTAVCLAALSLIIYAASKMPEFYSYYHESHIDWPDWVLKWTLYMFAWEFLFRGYMLFGLEKSIGKSAIFVQTIPFVLLHFGCVFWETLACIPEGFIFGYIAYRTRSFLPCFIIHIGIHILMAVLTY